MTKEQYEDFRLMLKGCGAGLPMYSTLNRFERVWFSSIIEILTEKDKQIADLEEQNSQMFNTIALQEQQIEKMKDCYNCHYSDEYGRSQCGSLIKCYECKHQSNWKLKE